MSRSSFAMIARDSQPASSNRLVSLLLVLFIGVGVSASAVAQTVSDSVTDARGNVLYKVGDGGGMLVPGTFGEGTISSVGAGTRLLWQPAKAAFRAGRVGVGLDSEDGWNDEQIGAYSVAFGLDTRAQGRGAVAMGQGTTAEGDQTLAAGYRTTASGTRSMSVGDLTTASGNFATALGLHTTARSMASVALGRWNTEAGTRTSWEPEDPLLMVGNGTGPSDRSNALLLRKNGNLTIGGTLTEHSDRRLKTEIQSLGDVSASLAELRPVHFRFKEGTGHPTSPQIGLLAQDVQSQFPRLARKGPDGYLSVAYPKLTAVLVKGVQEQRARIDSLKQHVERLEHLEDQQAHLVKQVEALQSQERTHASTVLGVDASAAGSAILFLIVGGIFGAAIRR